ncbi:xanthine dehydrogenase family protein molybdopterin-binding subunit [Pseudonocardia kunmingensis]|uniref:Xanthine dehydrogenase YagR molybdenum-binding subunit n=1 Tax=Pseudonocardia kunmingensis TaxID=630975 RepID=A0A543DR24_9PSEU|nr:xanthine dehydrogenase family protein molybdopterin-binding subunit [Pseudonocardia kunmingensis]TQM11777.1 xanthine dehydrogenase YagR molybdenum-binding subunit [Pseudonocardia kunmingensis]
MIGRLDAPLKVTGRARYALDNNVPGMVFGHVVLSTVAHGEITDMDVTAARSAPGVLAVYTPFAPLPLTAPVTAMLGPIWVPLQSTDVTYYGQPIGFVVAETVEQARDAAALVRVTYDERPASTSMSDGLATAVDAPPSLDGSPPELSVLAPGVESIEDALAASPVVVDATYTTATQNHAAMEPHSAMAVWESGTVTVYTGNQGSDLVASALADALGEDHAAVRVVNPFVGGAFGGKALSIPAFLAAAAARDLDRPVKAALTREQVFTATATRPATVQRLTVGAERDGTLVALRHDSWSSTPAGGGFVEPTSHGTSREWYATPNVAISQKMVPLHVPPTTFMRAPGEAPGSFALESAIDELAVKLDMDPIALRQRNNSAAPPGKDLQWSSKHLDECFRVGAARFGWAERTPRGRVDGDWLVGMGTATAMFPALRFPASVRVTLRDDDTAEVATSGADPGTGLLTVLSLIGAESLDIAPEKVTPRLGDSALPPGGMSGGSTATASAGSAIMVAAPKVIDDLVALASGPGAPFEGVELSYADGRVLAADGRSLSFGEVLRATGRDSIAAVGSSAPGEELTKHSFSSFGAQFCEVRVHRWTREARVSRMLGVFDAGRVINEQAARSQIMGGMIWGVSAALHEGLEVEENGRLANADFANYLLPVNADIPEVDVEFVRYPDTLHNPVGARGLGEIGVVGMAAAVANAVFNATGIRVRRIPIAIEDLLEE